MFAPRFAPLSNNLCFYCQNRNKIRFQMCVFLQLYLEIVIFFGLVIDELSAMTTQELVISCLPKTKFLHNLKAKRCNVNLVKINRKPSI